MTSRRETVDLGVSLFALAVVAALVALGVMMLGGKT